MTDTSSRAPIAFLDLRPQRARIETALRARLDKILESCQFVLGPDVIELEARLAAFCGARHCVAVSSGTDALQIALMADNIGRGDAVFIPAFTYTATAEVATVLGATPVFVDIEPATFQIDIANLRARITQVRDAGKLRPRAIMGVDLFGQPADWPAINALATEFGLVTIDDAAQSFGASLHGKMLGGMAHATATSFFPSKPLGAYGDGGALFTDDDARAALFRSLRSHGEGAQRYEVLRTGMNGRLDTIQAAVLLCKLDVFADDLAARAAIADLYDRRLAGAVQIPARVPHSTSAWAIYSILLPDQPTRDRLAAALRADGVPSAIYYPKPLHHQPAYAALHDGAALPVSETIGGRILALPLYPDLPHADAERICDAVLANL